MAHMIEVFYKAPADPTKETGLTHRVEACEGHLTFREDPDNPNSGSVCLTFEFDSLIDAQSAVNELQDPDLHVEGPVDYGATVEEPVQLESALHGK